MTDRCRITWAVVSAGLGYSLHSCLFLSADVAGGHPRVKDLRQANVTQALLEDERQRATSDHPQSHTWC